MSLFPVFTLGVILVGAATVGLIAWRRPRYAPVSAGLVLGLTLLLWLIAGQNLPLGQLPDEDASTTTALSPFLYVDAIGWQLSFYLLLTAISVVASSLLHFERFELEHDLSLRQKALFPAILLVCAAALLALWMATVAGLITSWVILSFAWLVLLWAMSRERVSAGTLLTRGGAMLLGTLFSYFRLDTATKGYYTGRLQFAAAAAILTLVAASVLLAKWIPWM